MASEGDTDCSLATINESGTSLSDFGDCSLVSKKDQKAAKKFSRYLVKNSEKLRKKKDQNKITKHHYCEKSLEFKTWIAEYKKLNPENLSPKRSRYLFKKFVKKWNHKKLPQQYYRGVDVLWASMGSPASLAGWALPANVANTSTTPNEERLVHQYSRTPVVEAGFSTFGRRKGKKLVEKMKEMERSMANEPNIYAEPFSSEQKETSDESFYPGYQNLSPDLDQDIPTEEDPGYATIRRPLSDHNSSADVSTATIHRACTRASRCPSVCDISSLDDLNQSTLCLSSRCASIPCIPQIPNDQSSNAEFSKDKKRKMNKQDSYVSNIESTSYDMFERQSVDKVEWKVPPPKPMRVSSVKKSMAPPPPPACTFASPPFPPPPPPLTDECIYQVPCNVDKNFFNKARKSTGDLTRKKKSRSQAPPPLPHKRPAPPIPTKPKNLQSSIYQNIVSQVLGAETPVKGSVEDAGPVLLKTPAGTFLVTKLNGPLTEVSNDN